MSEKIVEWNGHSYDVDPTELTMGEYEEIAKRGGPDGMFRMVEGLQGMNATAWKAMFWIQDRRRDPDLSFGDYAGPTFRVILDARKNWPAEDDDAGTAGPGKAPSGTDGSASSPTSSVTPRKSSTR